MDYGSTTAELTHLDRLHSQVEEWGRRHDLLGAASSGEVIVELEEALADAVTATAPLHERLLVVEEAARLGLPALPGLRLLVGAEVLDRTPSTSVAVIDRQRCGPVRNAPYARTAIVLDGAEGWVVDVDHRSVVRVPSSFGYPYGELIADGGTRLAPAIVASARSRWNLLRAAEMAGTASGALRHVTAYLSGREQFGQRLAEFQALRHRVAELAVSTEAAVWLVREAAWHGDARRAGVALTYARDLAAAMAPEIVQLCGARGFTREFPAHLFAMRLEGLRLEVGAADRLARALLAAGEATVAV